MVLVSTLLMWLAPVAIMQSMVAQQVLFSWLELKQISFLYISIYNAFCKSVHLSLVWFYDINTLVITVFNRQCINVFPGMYLAIRVLKGNYFIFLKVITKPIIFSLVMVSVIFIYSLLYFKSIHISNCDIYYENLVKQLFT